MNHKIHQQQDDEREPMTEHGPDSPSSGEDSRISGAPSPKRRKCAHKKVVSVPVGDVDGSRSKGETYSPSDSWAWRKYGQKPIKGSPYPRGYYRCSSSKGCPARKQVERSRMDPTMLVITYAGDHNHPSPTTTKQRHHQGGGNTAVKDNLVRVPAKLTAKLEEEEEEEEEEREEEQQEQKQQQQQHDMLTWHANIELCDGYEFGWYADVAATSNVLESPICEGSSCSSCTTDADVATMFKMREEDELLFADLGELPECSMVFRRNVVEPEGKNRTCSFNAVSCCAGTR